ncbi:hypothetical protein DERF_006402 [Dermatophagoides farinae]|uniref:Uncharacterized protein n=1 Tax=Dermatophagoides farinae TaxID=6954 RepID=A0A922I7G0_DERFA|nr:hypothetical protein DERF_006402 [Dermatophagoides farinae]
MVRILKKTQIISSTSIIPFALPVFGADFFGVGIDAIGNGGRSIVAPIRRNANIALTAFYTSLTK